MFTGDPDTQKPPAVFRPFAQSHASFAYIAARTSGAPLLRAILFQVEPRDPAIFGGVAVVLVAVGLVACLVPAKRATATDPLIALRSE